MFPDNKKKSGLLEKFKGKNCLDIGILVAARFVVTH